MESIRDHIKKFGVDHPNAEKAAKEVSKTVKSMDLKDVTEAVVIGALCAAGLAAGPAGLAVAGVLSIVAAIAIGEL